MKKSTVLAKIRLTVRFTPDGLEWLRRRLPGTSLAVEDGSGFLLEFSHAWEKPFLESANKMVQHYFREHGVPDDRLPVVEVLERYRGSFILEAAVLMYTTIGTAYTILKGISELHEIADGLTTPKARLAGEFPDIIRPPAVRTVTEVEPRVVRDLPPSQRPRPEPPPSDPVQFDLTIDARPLTSLTPAKLKSHSIYLACSISRESFVLENLGEEPIKDLRIGLFSSSTSRTSWQFADAYVATVPMLSGGQTIAKELNDFRHTNSNRFGLPDTAVYVDCWVQDNTGIYLFNFYLDAE
jgi:hypothetical protein